MGSAVRSCAGCVLIKAIKFGGETWLLYTLVKLRSLMFMGDTCVQGGKL